MNSNKSEDISKKMDLVIETKKVENKVIKNKDKLNKKEPNLLFLSDSEED